MTIELPAGCELVRTTAEFDETTLPAGLLRAHRIAPGVWGRLVVRAGSIRFAFDDGPDPAGRGDRDGAGRRIGAGGAQVIPPERPHHVTVDGPVRFVVEFHRPPS